MYSILKWAILHTFTNFTENILKYTYVYSVSEAN